MTHSASVDDLVVASQSPRETSYATVTGTTNTFRKRALDVRHKKATVKATVQELEVVRHGLRRLETRMHELESRVQYVNPWVVQHMWEVLSAVREKIGLQCNAQPVPALITDLRGGRLATGAKNAQSLSPPQQNMLAAETLLLQATQKRLFEGSADPDDNDGGDSSSDGCNTSLSSESDDDGKLLSTTCVATATVSGGDVLTDQRPMNSSGQFAFYSANAEARWLFYCLANDELADRMEVVLAENTERMFILSHLTSCLATTFREGGSVRSSATLLVSENDFGVRRTTMHQHSQRRSCDAVQRSQENQLLRVQFDMPSPPRTEISGELSPIAQVQSHSDFFSPLHGVDRCGVAQERGGCRGDQRITRNCDNDSNMVESNSEQRCDISIHEVTFLALALLKNTHFMKQIVEEVSRRLAAQIQQIDLPTEGDMLQLQGLPSALFLTVREAVNVIAGAHNDAFCNQIETWLAQEHEGRASQEERFWHQAVIYEKEWAQRVTAERQAEVEALKEHQRLLALGKEDVEACKNVHRELLKLSDEAKHAVQELTQPYITSLRNGGAIDRLSENTGDVTFHEKVDLQISALSTAINVVLSEMEELRSGKCKTSELKEGWCTQMEDRITTLQENMADVQEAVAIVARKSCAVEDRLDTSKAEKVDLNSFRERLQELEQQLVALSSFFDATATPLPAPLLPSNVGRDNEPNSISVESAMIFVQKLVNNCERTRIVTGGGVVNPYTSALSALCSTLQRVNHLYNVGTGTVGGSLHLIFALPPFSVPDSLGVVCRAYLREHSAAELKEAIDALGIDSRIAKVLYECYYWMQSHVLVMNWVERETLHKPENNLILTPTDSSAADDSALCGRLPTQTFLRTDQISALPRGAGHTREGLPPQLHEPPSNVQKVSITSCSTAVQTETPVSVLRTSHSNASVQAFSDKENTTQQQVQQGGAKAIFTSLEALAMGLSPGVGDSQGNVVHFHHHHYYDSATDGGHASLTPQCFIDKANSSSRRFLNAEPVALQSDNGGGQGFCGSRRHENTPRRPETPLPSGNRRSECAPLQSAPSLNHPHVFSTKQSGILADHSAAGDKNRSLSLAFIPSMLDECLPLPAAVSPFVDPQLAINTLSNNATPQPFYTAVTQRGPRGRCGKLKNGFCLEGSVPSKRQSLIDDAEGDSMSGFFQRHRGMFSSATKTRNNILSDISAGHF